jgi:excisionase family DNA binding protein
MSNVIAELGPSDIGSRTALADSGLGAPGHLLVIDGVEYPLSERARDALVESVAALGEGERVQVVRLPELLSTQEAADLLRVSRPTLVKMLEDGVLPCERPGTHRRVPRAAVTEFLETRRERRRAALREMAAADHMDGPDQIVATR